MQKFTTLGVLCIIGTAGLAHADLSPNVLAIADTEYRFDNLVDPLVFVTAEAFPAPNEGFSLPWNLDNSTHPLISAWSSEFSGGVSTTTNSFSINASSAISGSITEPADRNGDTPVVISRNQFDSLVDFEVQETIDATISFDGFASALATDRSRNELLITVQSSLGSFTDFTVGFNSGSTIEGPITFDTTLLAGDEITVLFQFEQLVRPGNDLISVFDEQSMEGTFSITLVPAPQSALLLGLGGLLSVRRRR